MSKSCLNDFSIDLKEKEQLLLSAQKQLIFRSSCMEESHFSYTSNGWFGRKCAAIPKAAFAGIIKTTYHLAAIILIVPFKQPHSIKKFVYLAACDLQEAWGHLSILFNDQYGLFYVRKSCVYQELYHAFNQPLKAQVKSKEKKKIYKKTNGENLTKQKLCFANFLKEIPLEVKKLLPKNFMKKILLSDGYTEEEKKQLFLFSNLYDQEVIKNWEQHWLSQSVTTNSLGLLTLKHPHFSLLGNAGCCSQFSSKKELHLELEKFVKELPFDLLSVKRTLYAYAIGGKEFGSHRTAFVIDLKNKTVQYYNSFGSDSLVKESLMNCANLLEKKYRCFFTYHSPTLGLKLQFDSFQCGVWAAKFIEERVKQGAAFDPRTLKDKNLAPYRKKVYQSAYKSQFYYQVGYNRVLKWRQQVVSEVASLSKESKNQFFNDQKYKNYIHILLHQLLIKETSLEEFRSLYIAIGKNRKERQIF